MVQKRQKWFVIRCTAFGRPKRTKDKPLMYSLDPKWIPDRKGHGGVKAVQFMFVSRAHILKEGLVTHPTVV